MNIQQPSVLTDEEAIIYMNRYEDVKKFYDSDIQKIKQHWIIYGKTEGRIVYEKYQPKYPIHSNSIGFIILRHVNSAQTDQLWKLSYESIRKFYPDNKIVIIDDSSDYSFVDLDFQDHLANTIILNSEFKGRGEILPYYYYLQYAWFDIAVIIHDSVFINSFIDFYTENSIVLWDMLHDFNDYDLETKLISNYLKSNELLEQYSDLSRWSGCFGAMSVINYNYWFKTNQQFSISNLIPGIKCRKDRMAWERILGCILNFDFKKHPLFGDIHSYGIYGLIFQDINRSSHLPIIKCWNGR